MIEEVKGNLLRIDAEALVNTVNCVGHMGKGIALQFKQAFPENFNAYKKACNKEEVQPGKMFVFETGSLVNPRYIINFPTKRHWRGKSRIEDVEAGLESLVAEVRKRNIRSIGIPPLGCGLGGLKWSRVRPLIERYFGDLDDVRVLLFAPQDEPEAGERPVRTQKPHMTTARALFIKIMQRYLGHDYQLTLLEIQKLAYFLQEAGESLKLRYEKSFYGPYAENLNKVLELIEGHFTRGYTGSRKPEEEIAVLPGAVEEADKQLERHKDSRERLERVTNLIGGFETPYGMELLSSVHWVATKEPSPANTFEEVVARVQAWNDRKRKILKPRHIEVTWKLLQQRGWLQDQRGD